MEEKIGSMKKVHFLFLLLFIYVGQSPARATDCDEVAKKKGKPVVQTCLDLAKESATRGEKAEALSHLRKSVEAGFSAPKSLETATVFKELQNDEEFKNIVQLAQRNATPCAFSDVYRDFDFWLGEWTVHANNRVAGENSIQLILDKCVIFENWTGANGYSGKSFNIYNASTKKWQQLWVDNAGGVLQLEGELHNGVLEYTGKTPQADGTTALEKITFKKLPNDRIQQIWVQSPDDGKTWNTLFDGMYIRKTNPAEK
jgi:hypothetical protein